jgi:hypothetical protein
MNNYPDNWVEVALNVKNLAEWRCVRCGHPDDPAKCKEAGVRRGWLPCDEECRGHVVENVRTKQRILTVHHFDGDKSNCRWWNLGALCQVCHLEIQGRVKMAQRWPMPHTPWFRPYVAGYYAWVVLGEDLPREQVINRMTELLTAGQPDLANPYGETI